MKQKRIISDENKVSARTPSVNDIGWDVQHDHEDVAPIAIAEYIRALRQNGRQGTVACKGRSDVAYANRKPWKQKGTGRARAGSARSPLWRHGGVIHGPQKRVRKIDIPQALRRNVMRSLFVNALREERIKEIAVGNLFNAGPCTKFAAHMLQQVGLLGKKIAFFTRLDNVNMHASLTNIPSINLYLFDQPNAYVFANADYWVYASEDAELFRNMVQQWK
jgi:large subunit ribosomal protein L4